MEQIEVREGRLGAEPVVDHPVSDERPIERFPVERDHQVNLWQ
jgi:hypothetical protein